MQIIINQFWDKVDIKGPDDCWLWLGATNKGYGVIKYNHKLLKAHRVAWEKANGPIPPNKFVLHTCDNPPCVNPNHLFLGTALDNVTDMIAKGRARYVTSNHNQARGEKIKGSKLTEEAIRDIKTSKESTTALGLKYGVGRHAIAHVRAGRRWAHV